MYNNDDYYDIISDLRNFYTVDIDDVEFFDDDYPDKELRGTLYFCQFRLAELPNWLFCLEPYNKEGAVKSSHVIYTQFEPLINKFKLSRSYYKAYIYRINREPLPLDEKSRELDINNQFTFIQDNCAFDIDDFVDMVKFIQKNPIIAAYNSNKEYQDYSYVTVDKARKELDDIMEYSFKQKMKAKRVFNRIFRELKILVKLGFVKRYYFDKSCPVMENTDDYRYIYGNSQLILLAKDTMLAKKLVEMYVKRNSWNKYCVQHIDWTSNLIEYRAFTRAMHSADVKLYNKLVESQEE